MADHLDYLLTVEWTGYQGEGTQSFRGYNRNYTIRAEGKNQSLEGSAEPAFRGDPSRFNPEEMLVASISACHMLWYLHLCADNGVIVTEYKDRATGTMTVEHGGHGRFSDVTLHPEVVIADESMITRAGELHGEAKRLCFIANSCNFPIHHDARCRVDPGSN